MPTAGTGKSLKKFLFYTATENRNRKTKISLYVLLHKIITYGTKYIVSRLFFCI